MSGFAWWAFGIATCVMFFPLLPLMGVDGRRSWRNDVWVIVVQSRQWLRI